MTWVKHTGKPEKALRSRPPARQECMKTETVFSPPVQDDFWEEHFLSNRGLCIEAGSHCCEDDSQTRASRGQGIIRADSS